MSDAYKKVQAAAKKMVWDKTKLNELILKTMAEISAVVGCTLGPGGQVVVLEGQTWEGAPMVTKDGVTVFRTLGFEDPVQQVIMQAARDAATRTATEAGDGTTSCTILSEAIVRHTLNYCKQNPHLSPQQVVRSLQKTFKTVIEPMIRDNAIKAPLDGGDGTLLLHATAALSANGDTELADAVLECFELTGDDGNVTILDTNGIAGYSVEHIAGYPIAMGFEDSCKGFASKFINDAGNQRCYLQKPAFIIYYGQLLDVGHIVPILEMLYQDWQSRPSESTPNVVVVATGFSEQVLANFAYNTAQGQGLKIFPLLAPMFPVPGGQVGFMEDLVTVTGQKQLLDPINNPLTSVVPSELGRAEWFEATRFRSNVVGYMDSTEDAVLERAEILKHQISKESSRLEKTYLQERLAKLTGGIARLIVSAPSAAEMRERKDRADDAVCAVRGAIKHGALPGGCWMLLKLHCEIVLAYPSDSAEYQILARSFTEPFIRLLTNAGSSTETAKAVLGALVSELVGGSAVKTIYNPLTEKTVDAIKEGIYDSVPAVLEAIRNSLSIATLLGITGAIVVFKRDEELERSEARANNAYNRDVENG